MTDTNKRICVTCGRPYKVCLGCLVDTENSQWLADYCCEKCRDIGHIIHSHFYKETNDSDAIDALEAIDAFDEPILADDVRDYLDNLILTAETCDSCNLETEVSISDDADSFIVTGEE